MDFVSPIVCTNVHTDVPPLLNDICPSASQWSVSESVQEYAQTIYQELSRLVHNTSSLSQTPLEKNMTHFETMQENVQTFVKCVVPGVVGLLAALEKSQVSLNEADIQLELAREDTAALLKQMNREKEKRRETEQRIMEIEEAFEDERDVVQKKIDQLEISVHRMNIRTKRSEELAARCQEKELQYREELERLQFRYRELFRKQKTQLASSNETKAHKEECSENVHSEPAPNSSLFYENDENQRSSVISLSGLFSPHPEDDDYHFSNKGSETKASSTEDVADKDNLHSDGFPLDIDELIQENEELVATKNALNVVNHDLITQLEFLQGENENLNEMVKKCIDQENRLKERFTKFEEENKLLRDQLDNLSGNEGWNVQRPGERSTFSREEMARVIGERNCFKEKLLDLEESVRRYHTLRCGAVADKLSTSANHSSNSQLALSLSDQSISSDSSSIWWQLFSLLLGNGDSSIQSSEASVDKSILHQERPLRFRTPAPTFDV